MEGALKNDAGDGSKGIGRKFFGARDKISGGVVDQRVDTAKFLLGGSDCFLDSGKIANVTAGIGGTRILLANLVAGFRQRLFAAAGEKNICAKLGEAQSHRAAKSGATAGDENRPALQ